MTNTFHETKTMKKSELRKLIREEISKSLKEEEMDEGIGFNPSNETVYDKLQANHAEIMEKFEYLENILYKG